jgi:hypothetical protein
VTFHEDWGLVWCPDLLIGGTGWISFFCALVKAFPFSQDYTNLILIIKHINGSRFWVLIGEVGPSLPSRISVRCAKETTLPHLSLIFFSPGAGDHKPQSTESSCAAPPRTHRGWGQSNFLTLFNVIFFKYFPILSRESSQCKRKETYGPIQCHFCGPKNIGQILYFEDRSRMREPQLPLIFVRPLFRWKFSLWG